MLLWLPNSTSCAGPFEFLPPWHGRIAALRGAAAFPRAPSVESQVPAPWAASYRNPFTVSRNMANGGQKLIDFDRKQ